MQVLVSHQSVDNDLRFRIQDMSLTSAILNTVFNRVADGGVMAVARGQELDGTGRFPTYTARPRLLREIADATPLLHL